MLYDKNLIITANKKHRRNICFSLEAMANFLIDKRN